MYYIPGTNVQINEFYGTKAMNGTFDAAAAAAGAPDGRGVAQTDLTATAHGFLAGSDIYIQSTDNYDGNNNIFSVPDANSMVIRKKYVAETIANTDKFFVGVSHPRPFEVVGMQIHLASAASTDEDLELLVDARRGTYWDMKLYDYSIADKQDIIWAPSGGPIRLNRDDILKITFTNTDDIDWGVRLLTRPVV